MLALQAFGQLTVLVESTEYNLFGSKLGHPSMQFVAVALNVFMVVPMAVYADGAVSRGARPGVAYTLAVLMTLPIACVANGCAQALYCLLFHVPQTLIDEYRWAFLIESFNTYVYSAFGILVFMNRRMADRILEGVKGAELRRVELERQLIDSRLATAEAQIDPQVLFSALARIKGEFERSAPNAEDDLNQLIQTLRTALARTVIVNQSGATAS